MNNGYQGYQGFQGYGGSQGNWFTGQPGQFQQLPTMTPQQRMFQQQMMQGAGQGMDFYRGILSGDPTQLNMMTAPMMRQFERQVVPGIAGRFAGGNSMRGSAFQNALGRAGTDLQTNMAQIQANLMQGAAGGMTNMAGYGMQPSFQNMYRPQTPGFMDYAAQAGGQFAQGMGHGIGMGMFGV